MAALICWLICAYISYEIAKSKGRNPFVWGVIGFFIFSIGSYTGSYIARCKR